MLTVWDDTPSGNPGDERLVKRLTELNAEADEARDALWLRRLKAAQAAGKLASDAREVLEEAIKSRDALRACLPDLVAASERYEDGDGVLTQPVRIVAEVIGRLDAASGLLLG